MYLLGVPYRLPSRAAAHLRYWRSVTCLGMPDPLPPATSGLGWNNTSQDMESSTPSGNVRNWMMKSEIARELTPWGWASERRHVPISHANICATQTAVVSLQLFVANTITQHLTLLHMLASLQFVLILTTWVYTSQGRYQHFSPPPRLFPKGPAEKRIPDYHFVLIPNHWAHYQEQVRHVFPLLFFIWQHILQLSNHAC